MRPKNQIPGTCLPAPIDVDPLLDLHPVNLNGHHDTFFKPQSIAFRDPVQATCEAQQCLSPPRLGEAADHLQPCQWNMRQPTVLTRGQPSPKRVE